MACIADINVSQGSVAMIIYKVRLDFKYPFNYQFAKESSSDFFSIGSDLTEVRS